MVANIYRGTWLASALLLASAGYAQTRTIPNTDPDLAVALGQGYLAETDELRQPCVTGDRSFVNRPEALLHFENALSQDELNEEITGSFSGGINVFIASAKVTNKLSSLVFDDSYHRRLVYKALYRTKTEVLANPKANALGTRLIGLADRNLSVANCGREYVESIQHGGQIYIALDFDFASKEIKNDITTRVEFSILGIKKVKEFSKQFAKYKASIKVQVDAVQIGGRPDELNAILARHPVKACRLDALDRCEALINELMDYANGAFPAQLDDSPIAYTTAAYTSRGLSALVADASPFMKAEQQVAHEELAGWYNQQQQRARKIRELIASPLVSIPQRRQLYYQRDKADQNVERLQKALGNCEATPAKCLNERDTAPSQLVALDESLLTPWRNFFYFCQLNDPEQSPGVQAVLRQLQTTDCEAATDPAGQLKTLDLRNLNLLNAAFLVSLPALEKLDISRNRLDQIYPLSRLTQLKELRMSRNTVDSLAPLEGLTRLEFLHAPRNTVTSLAPLTRLSRLKYLSIYDNLLGVEDLSQFLPNARKILSEQDACDYEGEKLVAAKRIDAESAAIYKELGFGPSLQANQSETWVNCSIAASTYD